MMLTNITLSQCQAIDLNWLLSQVQSDLHGILHRYQIPAKFLHHDVFPWYNFLFNTSTTTRQFLDYVNHINIDHEAFTKDVSTAMDKLQTTMSCGGHVSQVASQLGAGLYCYLPVMVSCVIALRNWRLFIIL